ncbi:hypothetical protein SteCoe_27160 [Stentor coeruleus]|uniref:EF-hand domain-containing protein n=1 Tax=Stentor coeruleus TaxID=5963 RepID=A0A1R2BB69_9CILI|nr:hypothetical protein SteCoe_27160 [Stentor coeruleus]
MDAVDRGKQILVMTVDIGDGRQDFITVYEHDDPAYLAQEFAGKYGLDRTLQKNLHIMIQENTKEVLKSDMHMKEPSETDSIGPSPFLSPIKTDYKNNDSKMKKPNNNNNTETKCSPSKGSIYSAVYKQLRKTTNSKSVSLMNSQSKIKKNGFNYGDYLYAKGIKDREQAEKFKEMKKQEQFEKEIHNFTFSPLINTNSSMISPRVYDKPENILLKKQEENKEKLKKIKESQEQEYYKECSFTPKINNSAKSKEGVKKHKELYIQAEERRERKEKRIEEDLKQWSFKPDVGNARKKNVFETTEQFLDRLETSKKATEEEMERIRKEKERMELEYVNSKPYKQEKEKSFDRHNTAPIWDYLYSQRDSKKKEIETSQLEFLKSMEAASLSKKTTENSDKIYNDFRIKQYERLFTLMDSDYDGQISASAINITALELPVLKVLTPFFEELEKTQVSISLQDFCQSMENYYKTLNVEKRAILIKRPDKKEEEVPERKPFISTTSAILAEKKRSSLPADFLERQSTVTKMTEMKLQKIRDEKEGKIEQECTFKPIIKT